MVLGDPIAREALKSGLSSVHFIIGFISLFRQRRGAVVRGRRSWWRDWARVDLGGVWGFG